jgi:alpha-tubulin suppressor-like RCC1 family protein
MRPLAWSGAIAFAALLHAGEILAATPAIGAGVFHSAALASDGTVRTWGDDRSGQLGIGRALYATSPTRVTGASGIRRIAAGSAHALAIKADGTVIAWGANVNGEVGDGTTTNRSAPVDVPGLTGVTAVSAGSGHSVALKSDGTVWIWGGVMGATPLRLQGLDDVEEISAGLNFALARKRDGTVWAWGENDAGQLGDGTRLEPYHPRLEPRPVMALAGVRAIAAGARHALALLGDGTVRAWGSNFGGALGDGTTDDRLVPVAVAGSAGTVALAANDSKSFAIRTDGRVLAWGNGYYGLGNGQGGDFPLPVVIAGLDGASAIAPGFLHAFALKPDGTLLAWGANDYGQIGDGTLTPRLTPSPMTTISDVQAIYAGDAFSLALKRDGTVYAWGDNTYGEVGNASVVMRSTPSVVALSGVEKIAVGGYHVTVLRSDGSVWAWGDSRGSQIGDGTSINRSSPVPVTGLGPGSGITALSAGGIHMLALHADGTIFSWGDNYTHALGRDGSGATPARVIGMANATQVAAGGGHSAARRSDGTVWTWGHNSNGQLGDGTSTALYGGRDTPQQVAGLANVRLVAAGGWHTVVLKEDGTLWAWGRNDSGQLGDGTQVDRLSPVRVAAALTGVVAISAGDSHTLALKNDGTVWGWGAYYRLAETDGGDTTVPAQMRSIPSSIALSAGAHSLVLRADGSVFGFGPNNNGGLGDGTFVDRSTAVAVRRENGAGSIAGNDWFLDLDPAAPTTIPPDKVPPLLVVARDVAGSVVADLQYRSQDIGTSASVYVFARAPASRVEGAAAEKDGSVQCVLAQLNAAGQLKAVSASTLQAYVTGVLTGQGQAVSVLNGVSTATIGGATFYVGYGTNASAMLANGTNRGVVSVAGSSECKPAAPQTGWWWNPAEGGRGYSIEVAGNHIVFASYLYDVSGRATWLLASGQHVARRIALHGTARALCGGQTLGGPPRSPTGRWARTSRSPSTTRRTERSSGPEGRSPSSASTSCPTG